MTAEDPHCGLASAGSRERGPIHRLRTAQRTDAIQAIPDGTPLACWLPIKPGLTVHGLRHGHKTWMAEGRHP